MTDSYPMIRLFVDMGLQGGNRMRQRKARRFAHSGRLLWIAGAAVAVRHAASVAYSAILAKTPSGKLVTCIRTLTVKDAKYGFGRLNDLACSETVAVAKHGGRFVVVMAVEEYERLKVLEAGRPRRQPRENDVKAKQ